MLTIFLDSASAVPIQEKGAKPIERMVHAIHPVRSERLELIEKVIDQFEYQVSIGTDAVHTNGRTIQPKSYSMSPRSNIGMTLSVDSVMVILGK